MAKQAALIQRFDGGLNNKDSKKDLPEGFLAEAKNIDVSSVGRIKAPGKFEADTFIAADGDADATINLSPSGFTPGKGLFSFKTDEIISSSNPGDSSGEYVGYTRGSGEVFIGNATETMAEKFDINSNDPSTVIPVYYYANGGLRVADATLRTSSTSSTTTFIPVERADSVWTGGAVTKQYYAATSLLSAPDMGDIASLSSGTVDPNVSGTKYHDLGDPGSDDIIVAVEAVAPQSTEASGLWAEGKYIIGISYVYIDGQESKISKFSSTVDVSDGNIILTSASIADQGMDKFIQGFRVYARNFNDIDDEFRLVLDVDLEQGSRTSLGDEFDALQDEGDWFHTSDPKEGTAATNQYYAYVLQNASSLTYGGINGYDLEEHALSFQDNGQYTYQTAVVANQRAFVGNVFYPDSEGKARKLGDRIQYTPVRKYDTFPQSYSIDVGTNDGDEIIKLVEFQDRLFVFKKNKLFIIDISSASDSGWKLIGEFENRGLSNSGAVIKTDMGLIWANEYGLFGFFDTVAKLSNGIDDIVWSTNINADKAQIGFIPKRNQILILGDASIDGGSDIKGYIYDMATQSIVNVTENSVLVDDKTTNFITYNQELCIMDETGELRRFNTTPAAHTVDIQTKEYDFGAPSVDKKINSIYITYKDANNVSLTYGVDGAALTSTAISGAVSGNNTLSNSSTRNTEKFTFNSSTVCKSIQLKLSSSSSTEADIEIEDITIVYRPRGLR